MLSRAAPRTTWLVALAALCLISLETGLRVGSASPDTRYTLPRFSLGYFWDTPLGWTSVIDGVPVNRDAVQFSSLAGFFNGLNVPVPPQDNVYVRFAGYALVGCVGAVDWHVCQLRAGQCVVLARRGAGDVRAGGAPHGLTTGRRAGGRAGQHRARFRLAGRSTAAVRGLVRAVRPGAAAVRPGATVRARHAASNSRARRPRRGYQPAV